jgi:hypothetical protein
MKTEIKPNGYRQEARGYREKSEKLDVLLPIAYDPKLFFLPFGTPVTNG